MNTLSCNKYHFWNFQKHLKLLKSLFPLTWLKLILSLDVYFVFSFGSYQMHCDELSCTDLLHTLLPACQFQATASFSMALKLITAFIFLKGFSFFLFF